MFLLCSGYNNLSSIFMWAIYNPVKEKNSYFSVILRVTWTTEWNKKKWYPINEINFCGYSLGNEADLRLDCLSFIPLSFNDYDFEVQLLNLRLWPYVLKILKESSVSGGLRIMGYGKRQCWGMIAKGFEAILKYLDFVLGAVGVTWDLRKLRRCSVRNDLETREDEILSS